MSSDESAQRAEAGVGNAENASRQHHVTFADDTEATGKRVLVRRYQHGHGSIRRFFHRSRPSRFLRRVLRTLQMDFVPDPRMRPRSSSLHPFNRLPPKLLMELGTHMDGARADLLSRLRQLRELNERDRGGLLIQGHSVREPWLVRMRHAEITPSGQTQYVIYVMDIRTRCSWVARKRFSEIYALRKQIELLYKRSGPRNDPHGSLQKILKLPFPPRAVAQPKSDGTIRKRLLLLDAFLRHVIVLEPVHQVYIDVLLLFQNFLLSASDSLRLTVAEKALEEEEEEGGVHMVHRELELYFFRGLNDPSSVSGKVCARFTSTFLDQQIGTLLESLAPSMTTEDASSPRPEITTRERTLSSPRSWFGAPRRCGRFDAPPTAPVFLRYRSKSSDSAGAAPSETPQKILHHVRDVMSQISRHVISQSEKPFLAQRADSGDGKLRNLSNNPLSPPQEHDVSSLPTMGREEEELSSPPTIPSNSAYSRPSVALSVSAVEGGSLAQSYGVLKDCVLLAVEEVILFPLLDIINHFVSLSIDPKEEAMLVESMRSLQSHSQSLFGIKRSLQREDGWQRAVDFLRRMDNVLLPSEKLYWIMMSAQEIFGSVSYTDEDKEEHREGRKRGRTLSPLTADDFLPIHIYVLVQSQLRQPLHTKEYLSLMIHPDKMAGEVGYFLTMFEVALRYIRDHLGGATMEETEERLSRFSVEGWRVTRDMDRLSMEAEDECKIEREAEENRAEDLRDRLENDTVKKIETQGKDLDVVEEERLPISLETVEIQEA